MVRELWQHHTSTLAHVTKGKEDGSEGEKAWGGDALDSLRTGYRYVRGTRLMCLGSGGLPVGGAMAIRYESLGRLEGIPVTRTFTDLLR